jgi:hypothetical protein
MVMYPDLDVDFHIVDRQDTSLESFVSPTEYDLFIRVRPYSFTRPVAAS